MSSIWRTQAPLSEDVFHHLAAAIVSGELTPGERLRDEAIGQQFGFSRMPVREALHRLERIGLVEIVANRRTAVTHVTPERVQTTLEYAGYHAGIAAHVSVPRLTDDERAEAVRLVERASETAHLPAHASAARRDLFSYLSMRAGNAFQRAHMRDMEYAFERNLANVFAPETGIEGAREEYRELREAIIDGDGDAAERIVRRLHGIGTGSAPAGTHL